MNFDDLAFRLADHLYQERGYGHHEGMPNYRRLYIPGATYFFTINLRDRKKEYGRSITIPADNWRPAHLGEL